MTSSGPQDPHYFPTIRSIVSIHHQSLSGHPHHFSGPLIPSVPAPHAISAIHTPFRPYRLPGFQSVFPAPNRSIRGLRHQASRLAPSHNTHTTSSGSLLRLRAELKPYAPVPSTCAPRPLSALVLRLQRPRSPPAESPQGDFPA